MSIKHSILTVKNLLQGEQIRGIGTSVISGASANIFNTLSIKSGIEPITSTFLFLTLFGNIFGYCLDIIFAKEKFRLSKYNGIENFFGSVPYSDIITRLKWLLKSFFQKFFLRFVVVAIIDSIINLTIIEFVINKLDEFQIMMKYKELRNGMVGGVIALLTFVLYLNTLRFNWAYRDEEDPVLNIVVLMWLTISMVIYLGLRNQNIKNKNK
mgnify:CR=1 FL=1|jgi:hypothetical protein